jgi:hypothetical protein
MCYSVHFIHGLEYCIVESILYKVRSCYLWPQTYAITTRVVLNTETQIKCLNGINCKLDLQKFVNLNTFRYISVRVPPNKYSLSSIFIFLSEIVNKTIFFFSFCCVCLSLTCKDIKMKVSLFNSNFFVNVRRCLQIVRSKTYYFC